MSEASATACRRYWISGRVQGVYYRASACAQARTLGLSGWARNLADGRVEVLAAGPAAALVAFERWLAQGPPRARVEAVVAETSGEWPDGGFGVR